MADEQLIDHSLLDELREARFRLETIDGPTLLESGVKDVDVILIDTDLLTGSAVELINSFRTEYLKIGIVVIAGEERDTERIAILESGADDYLVKPFDFRELVARVRSVARRISDLQLQMYRFHDVVVDLENHDAIRNGQSLGLTGHEFKLLTLLAAKPGKVFTRQELTRRVSDKEWHPQDRSIDVLVSKLRRKLDVDGQPVIRSLRGVGYQFAAHIENN